MRERSGPGAGWDRPAVVGRHDGGVLMIVVCLLLAALAGCTSDVGAQDEARASTVPTTVASTTTTAPPTTTEPGRVGVFAAANGQGPVVGSGRLTTYSVEVEEATGLDPDEVAANVERIFADPRSWPGDGRTSLQRVASGGGLRILVATPATVDQRCLPLNTDRRFSCHKGNRLNINADRWLHGTPDYPLPLAEYRANVINHEMGHALGHGHLGCPGSGQLAPVMMQQTKGLQGCLANSWPYPDRASTKATESPSRTVPPTTRPR